jgi:hypothetical protein
MTTGSSTTLPPGFSSAVNGAIDQIPDEPRDQDLCASVSPLPANRDTETRSIHLACDRFGDL